MTTQSYDENLQEISKLLKVKIDIEDNVLEGTGGYAVAHAVYRLQKVCNITDLDIGSNHCQTLDLQQTLQMWKVLKFLKTLPMEQNDNDSDTDSDSENEIENEIENKKENKNENKNDKKNANETENDNDSENDSENDNENEKENGNENDNEKENDKENDNEKDNERDIENDNDSENENSKDIKNDNDQENGDDNENDNKNDNDIICDNSNEHEVVTEVQSSSLNHDERLVMVNEVKNTEEEFTNPLILSQDLRGRCGTVVADNPKWFSNVCNTNNMQGLRSKKI